MVRAPGLVAPRGVAVLSGPIGRRDGRREREGLEGATGVAPYCCGLSPLGAGLASLAGWPAGLSPLGAAGLASFAGTAPPCLAAEGGAPGFGAPLASGLPAGFC